LLWQGPPQSNNTREAVYPCPLPYPEARGLGGKEEKPTVSSMVAECLACAGNVCVLRVCACMPRGHDISSVADPGLKMVAGEPCRQSPPANSNHCDHPEPVLFEGKVVCNFLELGQFGSPNSKGVSKGCAWGLFGGEHSLKVARSARIPPKKKDPGALSKQLLQTSGAGPPGASGWPSPWGMP
jgi:hypothetical protein